MSHSPPPSTVELSGVAAINMQCRNPVHAVDPGIVASSVNGSRQIRCCLQWCSTNPPTAGVLSRQVGAYLSHHGRTYVLGTIASRCLALAVSSTMERPPFSVDPKFADSTQPPMRLGRESCGRPKNKTAVSASTALTRLIHHALPDQRRRQIWSITYFRYIDEGEGSVAVAEDCDVLLQTYQSLSPLCIHHTTALPVHPRTPLPVPSPCRFHSQSFSSIRIRL